MGAILESLSLFTRYPRLWRYSVRPLALASLLFLILVFIGYVLVVPPVRAAIERLSARPDVAGLVASGIYMVAWFFLAGTVFLSIASFLSSLGFDKLSEEVEVLTVGRAVGAEPSRATLLADGIQRFVFTLAVSSVACCLGLFLAGIPGVLAAGMIGLFDFTASAYLRRGIAFGGQWGRVFRLRGWLTFLVGAGLLSMVPFVNLVCLPILVGAGTIMVSKGERFP